MIAAGIATPRHLELWADVQNASAEVLRANTLANRRTYERAVEAWADDQDLGRALDRLDDHLWRERARLDRQLAQHQRVRRRRELALVLALVWLLGVVMGAAAAALAGGDFPDATPPRPMPDLGDDPGLPEPRFTPPPSAPPPPSIPPPIASPPPPPPPIEVPRTKPIPLSPERIEDPKGGETTRRRPNPRNWP